MNNYLLRSSSSINIIKTKNMLRNQYRILEEYSSKKDKYSTKSMSNASYN